MALGLRRQGYNSNDIHMVILTPVFWLLGTLPKFDGQQVVNEVKFYQFQVLGDKSLNMQAMCEFLNMFTLMLENGPSPCVYCYCRKYNVKLFSGDI